MEIKVGEYIRTKYGIITKIVNTDEYCRYFGERLEDTIYIVDNEKLKYRLNAEDIKKHSFNIVDLIEEGDYVNGKKVLDNVSNAFLEVSSSNLGNNRIFVRMIKSILTKELFKLEEYIV